MASGRLLFIGRCAATALRGAFAGGVVLAALSVAACTLTAEEFEPDVVLGEARPGPGGAACPVTSECCDGSECLPGEVCSGGTCTISPDGSPDGGEECVGPDCPPGGPVSLAPSCSDGERNGSEPFADCGGVCERACELGQDCFSDGDCEPRAFCPSDTRVCTLAACGDGVQNGGETGLDCGGPCAGCAPGAACAQASDCASGVCSGARCAAPACSDRVRNGVEGDTDCGGTCPLACTDGQSCARDADCQSGVCRAQACPAGVPSCCQPPSCSDGVANGDEPAVDCGNAACGACELGDVCAADANCASGFCDEGVCRDPGRCDDGIVNGRESAADCGGGTCPRCRDLLTCREDSDCMNSNCDQRGICISCGDAVVNGTETDFDCGGSDPFCQRCQPGQRCLIGSDCASGFCFGGFC